MRSMLCLLISLIKNLESPKNLLILNKLNSERRFADATIADNDEFVLGHD